MKKRRFTGILLCIMMVCMTVFTGCSLITTDRKAYLNAVVATITNKETNQKTNVLKKELITAYNSYGYNYQEYYNMTKEEAINQTLELLINRKITIHAAESIYTELTEAEKTYLWQQTADALETNFKDFLNKVTGITPGSSDSSDARVNNGYVKRAVLKEVDGKTQIIREDTPSKTIEGFKYDVPHDAATDADKELIYTNYVKFVSDANSEAYSKAYNNYLKQLKSSEEGLDLSTLTKEVYLREIERLYTVNYENYMISKYEEYFTNYSDISTMSVQQILDLYTSMVRSAYTQYVIEEDSAYEENMKSDTSKVNYYLEGQNDTQFFNVAHVLFKFTDEQAARYKEIQTNKTNGRYPDEASYQSALNSLLSQVKPVVREKNDLGQYVETDKIASYEQTPTNLLKHFKSALAAASTESQKADIFNEFIYKYNDDPGMINAEKLYSIGVNKSEAEDGQEYKIYSSFVDEFNEAAIDLYQDGHGNVGDISDLVVSENGIHILFYAGKVQNLFQGINENFTLTNDRDPITGLKPIEVLYNARINLFVDKTVFDVIYSDLITDNFAIFQNLNMNELRNQYNIHSNGSAYKDLYKE